MCVLWGIYAWVYRCGVGDYSVKIERYIYNFVSAIMIYVITCRSCGLHWCFLWTGYWTDSVWCIWLHRPWESPYWLLVWPCHVQLPWRSHPGCWCPLQPRCLLKIIFQNCERMPLCLSCDLVYNVVLRIFCTQVVRKARWDLPVEADPVKVVLRSALMVPGAQSVMISGTIMRLLLFAGSLDYQLMVRLCVRNLPVCV